MDDSDDELPALELVLSGNSLVNRVEVEDSDEGEDMNFGRMDEDEDEDEDQIEIEEEDQVEIEVEVEDENQTEIEDEHQIEVEVDNDDQVEIEVEVDKEDTPQEKVSAWMTHNDTAESTPDPFTSPVRPDDSHVSLHAISASSSPSPSPSPSPSSPLLHLTPSRMQALLPDVRDAAVALKELLDEAGHPDDSTLNARAYFRKCVVDMYLVDGFGVPADDVVGGVAGESATRLIDVESVLEHKLLIDRDSEEWGHGADMLYEVNFVSVWFDLFCCRASDAGVARKARALDRLDDGFPAKISPRRLWWAVENEENEENEEGDHNDEKLLHTVRYAMALRTWLLVTRLRLADEAGSNRSCVEILCDVFYDDGQALRGVGGVDLSGYSAIVAVCDEHVCGLEAMASEARSVREFADSLAEDYGVEDADRVTGFLKALMGFTTLQSVDTDDDQEEEEE